MEEEFGAAFLRLLSPTGLVGLPKCLEGLLTIFLIRVLNYGKGLTGEDHHVPGEVLGRSILCFAFTPLIKVKNGLELILVLAFLLGVRVLRGVWQACFSAEHKVAHGNLIVPVNCVDDLSMVEDIESEEAFLVFEVFPVFFQANVESGESCLGRQRTFL